MKMISFMSMIRILSMIVVMSGVPDAANGAIGYSGGVYVQDFNSLASTGMTNFYDNSTLRGWYAVSANSGVSYSGAPGFVCEIPMVETITADMYTASAGGGSSGNLYSFGSGGSADRALGSISFGNTTDFYIGLCVANTSSNTLTDFTLTYDGEQWRDSGAVAQHLLVFYHVGDPHFLGLESWTQLTNLTFTSPRHTGTASALDGNDAANRVADLKQSFSCRVGPGTNIWFAWVDLDYEGAADHGLSIDNVRLSASTRLHVATNGNDANNGYSPETALRTIGKAASLAQAGYEVVIHDGVYYESVVLSTNCYGTASNPVVFRANSFGQGRVVLTSADQTIRDKDVSWTLTNASCGIYSVPYTKDKPIRVLYDNVDLYAYSALSDLETFTTTNTLDGEGGNPGPRHGWCYDSVGKKLYVRLHASGKYGTNDPNQHVMAVSPRYSGSGIVIPGKGPVYLQFSGITFETPGRAAIYTTASAITVQDCWFFGCPYGVRGNNLNCAATVHADDPYYTASEIVIERCEFTELSSYNDVVELVQMRQATTNGPVIFADVWHRKASGKRGFPADIKGYENGIAAQIGRNWIIRNNYIHDIFEGLANDSMSSSVGAEIYSNVFARLCDNAIETENHATNVVISQNVFLDVFEPFSLQPLQGTNWPSSIRLHQNIVVNTPDTVSLWTNGPSEARAVFKIGMSETNWSLPGMFNFPRSPLAIPGGADFSNNSVYFPGGRLVNIMGSSTVDVEDVTFDNNLFLADILYSSNYFDEGHFDFSNNLVVLTDDSYEQNRIAAGNGLGKVFSNFTDLGWANPGDGDFWLTTSTNALDKYPGGALPNIGAIQPGDTWFPPKVGPNLMVTNFTGYRE